MYKIIWGHLLINKSGCFRFTSDNQKYPNNKEQQTAAFEQYKKMIAVLRDVAKEKKQSKKTSRPTRSNK